MSVAIGCGSGGPRAGADLCGWGLGPMGLALGMVSSWASVSLLVARARASAAGSGVFGRCVIPGLLLVC